MDRFRLTIGKFEAIVDDQTEVTAVGNKLSVTFNDYASGKMVRLVSDDNIVITTLDDVVDKEYVREVRHHEKSFTKYAYFNRSGIKIINDFKKSIEKDPDFVFVDTNDNGDEVVIRYKDSYPKLYPLKKEREE